MQTANVRWRKSSYSGSSTNCVEVAVDAEATLVRDTKNRTGGHLTLPDNDWCAFLAAVKCGQLDR